ncbi:helix-turn-helix transcriptional regulator [Frankia sp. Cas3]|uniref:helix-turn-helix domain-containing protein n=1 Tax=Frankia sp. Cas3 TaxID=3073926 RepID=UPI002AD5721A|nr:helix-turn-helix transcriptional regulator [Frankia sp. Cas3]
MRNLPDDASRRADGLDLGAELASLRHRHRLSGQELASRAGMSQSKISRIETGTIAPGPDDIEAIVRALGEPDDVVLQFRQAAERIGSGAAPIIDPRPYIGRFQPEYLEHEAAALVVRFFQPALIPGLLQTSEYAQAIIVRFCELFDIDYLVDGADAVALRMERQKILYDEKRTFHFVLLESVLSYPVAAPAAMIAQIDRIRALATNRPNITIAFIPDGTELVVPPSGSMEIFDENRVLSETPMTIVSHQDPDEVQILLRIFAEFASKATTEIDPILDRHRRAYIEKIVSEQR